MRLLEFPGYWEQQDCLGTPIPHFLIEHLGSHSSNTITPVSSDDRARFIAKLQHKTFLVTKRETTTSGVRFM